MQTKYLLLIDDDKKKKWKNFATKGKNFDEFCELVVKHKSELQNPNCWEHYIGNGNLAPYRALKPKKRDFHGYRAIVELVEVGQYVVGVVIYMTSHHTDYEKYT